MRRPRSARRRLVSRRSLPSSIGAFVALGASVAWATPPPVVNCNDHGAGSLRLSLLGSASGDSIDLSALGCSTITLNTGALIVTLADLTIVGPATRVTISGKGEFDRIFDHEGNGTLALNYLNIEYGNLQSAQTGAGGCIYSKGSVSMLQANVTHCFSAGYANFSRGGGIATVGDLTLRGAAIVGNSIGDSLGGGVYVGGQILFKYSTISSNQSSMSHAGGIAGRSGTIKSSTISGNVAATNAGMQIIGNPAVDSITITDSTISGNVAAGGGPYDGVVGGIYSNVPITLQNSTVAFNMAINGKFMGAYRGVGVALNGSFTATLQSTLISNNTYDGPVLEDDVTTTSVTVIGANNLIRVTANPLPAFTGPCPLLGPLRNNGGSTLTHALLSHSPAIDAGNNAAGLAFDQRGSARVSPSGGSADVGAYEVDQTDIVYNAGFDGCP